MNLRTVLTNTVLVVSLALLSGAATGMDGTTGWQVAYSNPVESGEGLETGLGMSAFLSFDVRPRLGVYTALTWQTLGNPLRSDLHWDAWGLDLGLQYRPPGWAHFAPFARSGLGFRSVAMMQSFSEPRPVERYRWYYDEYGNLVEMRSDQVVEYDYYRVRLSDYDLVPVLFVDLGLSFPLGNGQYGKFGIAPEVTLRYEQFFRQAHRIDFSSVQLNFGFAVLF